MAGIFMGFDEADLFSKYKAPEVYFRNIDDTFLCILEWDRGWRVFLTFK